MAINQLDMGAVFNNALGTVAAHRGMQQQQEYRNFLRDNGEALMAGDPGALAGYAQYDPGGALSMRNNMNSERRAADLYKRQVAEFAANKSAAELQAEIQKTDQILMGAAHFYESKDPQGYAAFLSQNGIDPQKYPFQQFPAYARQFKGARDVLAGVLERQAPKGPLSAPGKVNADIAAGHLPPGTPLRGEGVKVTNENIMPSPDASSDFYKKLDAASADMYGALLSNGMSVPTRIAQIDELQALLQNSPSGIEAGLKSFAGNYGIETDGLDTIQAAQAIINKLVPEQRPAGSGPMSDADLALFKQSLPRLINTPGGNERIVNTLRGIAIYEMQQAEIAQRVAAREITPAEGYEALKSLENPLSWQRKPGATTIGGYTIEEVED